MSKPVQCSLFPGERPPTLREVADAVRCAGLDGLPEARRRADAARYQEVHVRSALTRATGMPFTWALNPYRGCTHACEYCYARKYQRHLELGAGDDFSGVILVKLNLPAVLSRELARAGWTRNDVAVGTATDPYQPIEGHYRLTRRCLALLAETRTPFSVVTKGPMVVRDLDVLRTAASAAGCQVLMSVPCVDEEVWQKLEPGTASPVQRLRAIGALAKAGVDAGVLMAPLLPGISTSRGAIERTVQAIADSGARFVGSNVAHLEPGVREHFLDFLAREFPELTEGYGRLYRRPYAPARYIAAVKAVVRQIRAVARPAGGADRAVSSDGAEPSAP